ncbi:DUF389 domain-containing protein [Sphingomicrobium sediminis]|uniref:DUF389 domain-containing protein n=1 Tax=Sphingomicrobium sediminis TaxID=2950949 RepID=A0A9X2EGT5_9SPHN|nr:DUF389 domain-containing protein [Sphingomicrobium sediminis]MCM8557745.1 DUF389 domain-containing protein [Sphingomicrobium sediminis]
MNGDQTGTAATQEAEQTQRRAFGDERVRMLALARQWWRRNIVKPVDQMAAIRRTKEECSLNGRYIFMTSMSAGIAVLGLILSSPAVVIGAMLLSPLMGPIIGAGFALAIWDVKWMRESSKTLFAGVLAAILLSAFITWMSPIQTVTSEIAARTRPNLLDLAVALFSALAGAYAMIKGRAGTIVGVAIAVALMPPLSVVGFGLATWNWSVFGGALMLFITNLVTIAAAAAAMARLYGFRTALSKKRGAIQSVIIVAALAILAVPLTISLSNIAFETRATRAINQALAREFDSRARFETPSIDWEATPLAIRSVVFTPDVEVEAERRAEAALTDSLGRPVDVEIEQFQVAVGEDAAEAALSAARSRAQAEATQRQIDMLIEKLALVAGVDEGDVIIDREKRRALVRARPIDGASLRAYRELEDRIAADATGWGVEIAPPARPLPPISIDEEGALDLDAVDLIAWAAKRTGNRITLQGPAEPLEAARAALAIRGVTVGLDADEDRDDIAASWSAPDAS